MKWHVAVAFLILASWPDRVSGQVPAGGEFQVNGYTTSYQKMPSVAADTVGTFVVTWDGVGADGWGVFAQRYDASGAPRGAQFRVNTYTTGPLYWSSAASDASGGFVVVWQGPDGDHVGVFGQRHDAAGARRGGEFRVNTHTSDYQYSHSIASDALGDFVVVWSSRGQDGSGSGIFGQRYDRFGVPAGTEFRINSYTTGLQWLPSVACDASGGFVVAWSSQNQDGSGDGIFGQRYDRSGVPAGTEFQINSYVTNSQYRPAVAADASGNFVVAWTSYGEDGSGNGIFAQRFDASGLRRGSEFQVSSDATYRQWWPAIASDASGGFVVGWASYGQDGDNWGIFARRYDATGNDRGGEFRVNTHTSGKQYEPAVASDGVGNFFVTWTTYGVDGDRSGVAAQRYGGLQPAGLAVDPSATGSSDGNGVLEPGELAAFVPSWRNVNGASQTFDGSVLGVSGPPGTAYGWYVSTTPTYGTVPDGEVAACNGCYMLSPQVAGGGSRPVTHWDATFTERLTPDALGQTKAWSVHVGESFTDVPKTLGYYKHVETLLHKGVTGGCGTDTYCPSDAASRQQMAVFTLKSREGSAFTPPVCGTTPMFEDVPVTSPFCAWVEELARRGVTSGCGGGNFCPTEPVRRDQMAVFVLRTLDPALDPPACGTPMFGDVPASNPFCKYIEELARRGVVSGCGGGNYCPTNPVTRGQMSVFLTLTFGLTLYGP